jgi:hypothetical protein
VVSGVSTKVLSGPGSKQARRYSQRFRPKPAAERIILRGIVPQWLKPDSLQSIYVRPEGRTLQKQEFFRSLQAAGWFSAGDETALLLFPSHVRLLEKVMAHWRIEMLYRGLGR